jgi:hypothetical protein
MAYARVNVMQAIRDKVSAITPGVDYAFGYRFVTSDPLGAENIGKLSVGQAGVGVYDTHEEKRRLMGFTNATLTVVVEFYYLPKVGQAKADMLNQILAELTKALTADQTLNGTALMIEDVSNSIDIDGIYDRIINGSITFHVTYRHGLFDPTSTYLNIR